MYTAINKIRTSAHKKHMATNNVVRCVQTTTRQIQSLIR